MTLQDQSSTTIRHRNTGCINVGARNARRASDTDVVGA